MFEYFNQIFIPSSLIVQKETKPFIKNTSFDVSQGIELPKLTEEFISKKRDRKETSKGRVAGAIINQMDQE